MIEYLPSRSGGWTVLYAIPIGKRLVERVVLARSIPSKAIAERAAPVLVAAWKAER